jgi:hypothetical protein
MIIYRLTGWLRRVVGTVVARFRVPPPDVLDRTTVAANSRVTSTGMARPHVSGSWLDDARRLRPKPAPLAKLDRRVPPPATPPAQPTRDPARSRPLSGRQSPPQRPGEATPASQPDLATLRSAPLPSAPLEPAAAMSDQGLQRQLLALRRLVRLGIYNEGFDPAHVPEQYHFEVDRDLDG